MTCEVDLLAAGGIVGMMELGGVRSQGVLGVVRESRRRIEFRMFQIGAAITVPQTLQVLCATLE